MYFFFFGEGSKGSFVTKNISMEPVLVRCDEHLLSDYQTLLCTQATYQGYIAWGYGHVSVFVFSPHIHTIVYNILY